MDGLSASRVAIRLSITTFFWSAAVKSSSYDLITAADNASCPAADGCPPTPVPIRQRAIKCIRPCIVLSFTITSDTILDRLFAQALMSDAGFSALLLATSLPIVATISSNPFASAVNDVMSTTEVLQLFTIASSKPRYTAQEIILSLLQPAVFPDS